MTYDVEKLFTDLVALAQSPTNGINARLAAIAAEKGDGVGVATVPDEAYFFQDMLHERAPAYDVLCFYGMEDPEVDSIGPASAESHTLYFIICMKETGETTDMTVRLLRYARAMREVFERGYTNNSGSAKLSVSSISPTRFEAENNGFKGAWRCCGVKIKTVLA